ncbi:hypothetical protein GCM10020221_10690 [Streptomyces thioluteus]|uniref:Uncharacterized protein n=1 Tax=Streptomyces thioluteus TaxID=66431 RepID=A0ABN3WK64_STRTU
MAVACWGDSAAPRRSRARTRGEQLGQAEGLGDVVVGAGVQADDGVHLVGAGGEDEDGETLTFGAQPAADLQTVHAGQPEIEDEQIDVPLDPGGKRGRTVLTHLHLVPLAAQGARERLRDGRVILGEQYSGHGGDGSPLGRTSERTPEHGRQRIAEPSTTPEPARMVPYITVIHVSTPSKPGRGVTYGYRKSWHQWGTFGTTVTPEVPVVHGPGTRSAAAGPVPQ